MYDVPLETWRVSEAERQRTLQHYVKDGPGARSTEVDVVRRPVEGLGVGANQGATPADDAESLRVN
jgi:hypothetical protein